MRVNRFVLDCNIWVSYFITNQEYRLIEIIADNDLTIFSCVELFDEIERVLDYPNLQKYKVSTSYVLKTIRTITVFCELQYPIKNYIPLDKDDDYIIALALQTSSGFITSGGKDILSKKKNLEARFKKLVILTKAEFEKMFKKQKNPQHFSVLGTHQKPLTIKPYPMKILYQN